MGAKSNITFEITKEFLLSHRKYNSIYSSDKIKNGTFAIFAFFFFQFLKPLKNFLALLYWL